MSRLFIRSLMVFGLVAAATPAAFAETNGQASSAQPALAPAPAGVTCTGMTVIDRIEDSATSASTTSSNFVPVPNATVSFTQGAKGCVIATFSAESWVPGGNRLMLMEALLDGSTVGAPGSVQFSGDDDENSNQHWARSHSFTFAFNNVSAGAHSLAIKYRSFQGGARVYLGKHSLVVTHP